ncbi:N-acetylmuramoyl-L-alanine amidase [Pseudomonas chlororaphis subsp. aurantiaca]|uniref:N-acetylmuramoyl-L-alanine amidase n=1 Tax=Pseudomonas chlororaphis TaxID=587753 RepID=UPI000F6BDCB2|nr:N-acetylmuramoyl-L-alanine amidase [Pseudomonas chlororaphis]AZD21246.1 N-acetylmuramoyl-L-alanine amidase [Pseudomonas chlororaphis subsp. aurantiaca]
MNGYHSVEAISPAGELIWPCLLKPDTTYDELGVYKTKLKVRADDLQAVKFRALIEKVQQEEHERQVQEAESKKKGSGKKVRLTDLPMEETKETGVEYLLFHFKAGGRYTDKKTGQVVERKIAHFDNRGLALPPDHLLTTGTVARISVFISPFYTTLLGAGVTLRIRAVKVVKEAPTAQAQDFGFSDNEETLSSNGYGFGSSFINDNVRPYLKDRDRTDLIVVHCSATGPKSDIGKREITQWHLKRGFVTIGYHYVIRRDGSIETGRRETEIGAHVAGHNSNSVGVCMVGGVDAQGKPADNFTEVQYDSLRLLLGHLTTRYGSAKVVGHRDLSPDHEEGLPGWHPRDCPGFDAGRWFHDDQ